MSEKGTVMMTNEAVTIHAPQIYQLIGKAIGEIGAIGKDKRNPQQGFMYRGIDQVYNALNPVMARLGIFFVPEVLDMKREERTTKNGTVLTYTILTMKYTAFAPDGSSVSMTVVGEGMDSGDKGCNKAMSVAMKYAMFQLFCIPTEELKDPDADVYKDVMPQNTAVRPQVAAQQASVAIVDRIPAPQQKAPETAPVAQETEPETPGEFLKRMIGFMQTEYADVGFNFIACRKALIDAGLVKDIPSATMTMEQANELVRQVTGFYEDRKAAS